MNYIVQISENLGVDYNPQMVTHDTIESAKNQAQAICGNRRWVITDTNDNPVAWCNFIQSMLDKVPETKQYPGAVMATDDNYVKRLLVGMGMTVFSTDEVIERLNNQMQMHISTPQTAREELRGFLK